MISDRDLDAPPGCCSAMAEAFKPGTDNEGYGQLASYDDEGRILIGWRLEPISFCPWCGQKIESP